MKFWIVFYYYLIIRVGLPCISFFQKGVFCFILNFDLIPILLEKSTLSPSTTSKPKEVSNTEKPQCNCQCPNNIENVLPGVHTTKKPDPPPQVEG